MNLTVNKLIEGRSLVSANLSDTVKKALEIMISYDYSQLPILDNDGALVGAISDQTVARSLFHWEGRDTLLDLTVDNCNMDPATVEIDDSLFAVLDDLQKTSFVVAVESGKPVGIITDYDVNNFFRSFSEDLMVVRQVEEALRTLIEAAFDTPNRMQAALCRALGYKDSDKSTGVPKKQFNEIDFSDHVNIIVTEKNWEKFKNIFGPKQGFKILMDKVGDIRNQLAHFREDLTAVQRDALRTAASWVDSRMRRYQPAEVTTIHTEGVALNIHDQVSLTLDDENGNVTEQIIIANEESGDRTQQQVRGRKFMKYRRLTEWLKSQDGGKNDIRVSFSDIENLVGTQLPTSAYKYRSYWTNSNEPDSNSQVWQSAGWRVANVDLSGQTVTFHRTGTNSQQAEAQ